MKKNTVIAASLQLFCLVVFLVTVSTARPINSDSGINKTRFDFDGFLLKLSIYLSVHQTRRALS